MACVHIFESTHFVKHAVENSGIAISAGTFARYRFTREKTAVSAMSIEAVV